MHVISLLLQVVATRALFSCCDNIFLRVTGYYDPDEGNSDEIILLHSITASAMMHVGIAKIKILLDCLDMDFQVS